MLQPKKTKFRKAHKGRIHGAAKGGTALNFGSHGLKALEPERVGMEAQHMSTTRNSARWLFAACLSVFATGATNFWITLHRYGSFFVFINAPYQWF